jgi:hypothetical protein
MAFTHLPGPGSSCNREGDLYQTVNLEQDLPSFPSITTPPEPEGGTFGTRCWLQRGFQDASHQYEVSLMSPDLTDLWPGQTGLGIILGAGNHGPSSLSSLGQWRTPHSVAAPSDPHERAHARRRAAHLVAMNKGV